MDLSKQKFDGIRRNIKGKRQILRKKNEIIKLCRKSASLQFFRKKEKKYFKLDECKVISSKPIAMGTVLQLSLLSTTHDYCLLQKQSYSIHSVCACMWGKPLQ